jgi:hypothetical protein
MDPQQLAMLLQQLSPEQRAKLMGMITGGSGMPGGDSGAPGGGSGMMANGLAGQSLMRSMQGQPLSPTAAGMVGAGQAASDRDAWKMSPVQALGNVLGGFGAGRGQQGAALGQQQQGQSGLMNILNMLQGQRSYGTSGYAQPPVLGPGGRLGGGT